MALTRLKSDLILLKIGIAHTQIGHNEYDTANEVSCPVFDQEMFNLCYGEGEGWGHDKR